MIKIVTTKIINTDPTVIGYLTSFDAMPFEIPADCAKNLRIMLDFVF